MYIIRGAQRHVLFVSGTFSVVVLFKIVFCFFLLALSLNLNKPNKRKPLRRFYTSFILYIFVYLHTFCHVFFSVLQPLPPPLYIITPTYKRAEQVAEITRLGNTLKHIPNLYWLVIEDAMYATALVTRQLQRIGIPFEHLIGKQ